MDCDDLLFVLARPDHDEQQLERHLAGCEDCRELMRELEDDGDHTEPSTDSEVRALVGQRVGPYEIIKVLGAGGMGVVYLAVHPEIGSRVAIKVFSRDWSQHPRLVARFFAEARATNAIAHENIVNVLDVGRLEDGRPYLVMEHLLGRSLAAMLGTHELTDAVTQQLILDVLGALVAAHEHGIVHRDLKPDNIFVSPELRATLLDFGVAKLRPELTRGATATVSGMVIGTPQYMSPEQARGEEVDERADLYAIGVILYECLLGRRPFEGSSMYLLLEQQVHRPPIQPRLIRPELGADLEQVVLTALAKRPEDRFASAHDLQTALAACRVSSDRGAFVVQPETWTRHEADTVIERDMATVASSPRSRPRAGSKKIVVAAVLTAAVASAVVVTWWIASRPDPDPDPDLDLVPGLAAVVPADAPAAPVAIADDAAITPPPVVDAGVPTKPLPLPKPRAKGTAPLALLASADKVARTRMADVVLVRIVVRWPTTGGLIDRTSGGSVDFDYLSPTLAERFADRKIASCLVRVTYGAKPAPELDVLTSRCATLRPLPPPNCSLAALFKTAYAADRVPAGQLRTATFMMTAGPRDRRPKWEVVIGATEYDIPAC
jgi:serine/threonine protein kinase